MSYLGTYFLSWIHLEALIALTSENIAQSLLIKRPPENLITIIEETYKEMQKLHNLTISSIIFVARDGLRRMSRGVGRVWPLADHPHLAAMDPPCGGRHDDARQVHQDCQQVSYPDLFQLLHNPHTRRVSLQHP